MSQYLDQSPPVTPDPDQGGTHLNMPSLFALILGVLSILTFGCALLGIPAIVLGLIGLRSLARSEGLQKGKGLALAGLTLGI